jgi:hypothetical protein
VDQALNQACAKHERRSARTRAAGAAAS